ncbi:MAG: GtrA family protein, partial [Candidatus Eremiobacteraeota bacterium]|nr:GtrA family protein [Candidatus Eremiobacteraeota bacterium]
MMRTLGRRRGVRQFVKFGIVGASGTIVNFIVAHALEKSTDFSWFADFSIGFMAGGLSNYLLNRVWTFRSKRNPWIEGTQFLAVSSIALLAGNLVIAIAQHSGFHHFTATWLAATL